MITGHLCRTCARTVRRSFSSRPTTSNWASEDGYHYTPQKDGELSLKVSMSKVNEELLERRKVAVKAISNYGFRLVDDTFLYGPVALFPKVALSWKVRRTEDITWESVELFTLFQPKLDIVIVGAGDVENTDMVRRQIAPYFKERGMPYEIMATADAIALFNYMNEEGRYVAAALFPPKTIKLSKHQELLAKWNTDPDKMWGYTRNFYDTLGSNFDLEVYEGKKPPPILARMNPIERQLKLDEERREYFAARKQNQQLHDGKEDKEGVEGEKKKLDRIE